MTATVSVWASFPSPWPRAVRGAVQLVTLVDGWRIGVYPTTFMNHMPTLASLCVALRTAQPEMKYHEKVSSFPPKKAWAPALG